MHQAAFHELGLPHRYLPFRVTTDALHRAIDGARAMGFGGLNLTVPHKQDAVKFMDEVTEEAERIGAINVICFADGWAVGHNTDGRGFLDALSEIDGGVPRRAVVLGSGGASLAIVDALVHAYPGLELRWVSRTPQALVPPDRRVLPCGYDDLPDGPAPDLLVNATTVGMAGGPEEFPREIDLDRLPSDARVVDVVYPRPRGGLLDRAEARGLAVQDGLAMLLWQGVRSLELWLGEPVAPEVVRTMRAAIELQ
jgi:shikimate dehydrogenase